MADAATESGGAVGAKKRILFNKPSWSKPLALSDGANLFHRSNHVYVDSAAEAERGRKKRLARTERRRTRSKDSEVNSEKRRRISWDEDEKNGSSSNENSNPVEIYTAVSSAGEKGHEIPPSGVSAQEPSLSPTSVLQRYEAATFAKALEIEEYLKTRPSNSIDLDEGESLATQVDTINVETALASPSRPPEIDDQHPSDEEYPELARQAREKAQRKRHKAERVSTTPDLSHPIGPDGYLQRSQSLNQSTSPHPPPDPILQILITSAIPNTEPLIVSRRLSQRLKEVRVTWAQRQQFTPEFAETVFLTWRGRRLFDVASCKSLGITVSSNGNIRSKRDTLDDLDGKIHMEAMTAAIFEAYKKAKIHEVVGEKEAPTEEHIIAEQNKEPQMRIILKSKGIADVKILVKHVGCSFVLRML